MVVFQTFSQTYMQKAQYFKTAIINKSCYVNELQFEFILFT